MTCLLVGFAIVAQTQTPSDTRDLARQRIEQAMRVLGGREKLASIRQLTVSTMGHGYLVEQSERPAGPYITVYTRGTRAYDFDSFAESSELSFAGLVYGAREFKGTFKIEKGVGRATPMDSFMSYRRLALGPERVLIYAAEAPDIAMGSEALFNGVAHSVVKFKWGSMAVRLYLNKATGAPSGLETTSTLPFPWSVWGDVPVTTRWGAWQVLENAVIEPSQFTTEINGYPVSDETILSAKATLGPGKPVLAPPIQSIPEDPKPMLSRYKAVQVAEGITQYQGPFNTFVVEQPDGLLVIEPVMTPEFASAFLDRLAKEHPGKRLKAVIATDDAWPHFGGIRTFVARGADLVVLDLNRPLVQRFCDSIHASQPDELSLRPAKPRYRTVRKPTTIGSGPNRMVLYPIAGQGSERMLMAYFPSRRLLYGSDLLQKQGDGFFFPAYPRELCEAVKRERLDVDTVFAEHLAATPWKIVTSFVDKAMADSR
jgi:hypothetical protein